jgi:endo-1,4-beta-D-glucanase Y
VLAFIITSLTLTACSGIGNIVLAAPAPNPQASTDRLLSRTWETYKHDFIQSDGRVIDHERNVTTSEGESYGLLRAVWMGDRREFDTVLRWTRDNLLVSETGLYGYLWGPDSAGQYRLLSRDSASDADEDIALALFFAAHRWRDEPSYGREGRRLLAAIWNSEVAYVLGIPYLTAGPWAPHVKDPGPVLNPSYLAPYAYRIFDHEDSSHPWRQLVDSSYRALNECSRATLQANRSVGLPPNWCALDSGSGQARSFSHVAHADNYGYDAFRVMWRVAIDAQWSRTREPQAYLQGEAGLFLRQQWARSSSLAAEYGHDGSIQGGEDLTVYGGDIGAFVTSDQGQAHALERKLINSYREQDGFSWFDRRRSYYEQNWVWFGIALAEGRALDLTR